MDAGADSDDADDNMDTATNSDDKPSAAAGLGVVGEVGLIGGGGGGGRTAGNMFQMMNHIQSLISRAVENAKDTNGKKRYCYR